MKITLIYHKEFSWFPQKENISLLLFELKTNFDNYDLFQVSLKRKKFFNPLNANPTKWSNTLKQFVGRLPTNCLSVFDHFVKLALKGLSAFIYNFFINQGTDAYLQPSLISTIRWSFFTKIVNGFYSLTTFAKKFHRRCSSRYSEESWHIWRLLKEDDGKKKNQNYFTLKFYCHCIFLMKTFTEPWKLKTEWF